jgi:4-hydroxybenzoate polyprenyltransferase
LLLLTCGTVSGYGLDRLIDREGLDTPRTRKTLKTVVILASVIALVLACTAVWRFVICIILGLLAGGYVPLKRILPKNLLTVPAWTIAVCALPFDHAPDGSGRNIAAAIAVAYIILANTVLCDLSSVEEDRAAGVRGFAVRYGVGAGAIFAGLAAILGMFSAFRHELFGLSITAMSLIPIAIILGRDPRNRLARHAADLVLIVLPGPVSMLTR